MAAPNYPPTSDAERETLLQFVREAPIVFGSWRFLKGLFKKVEADPNADPAILGTLLARMDTAPLSIPVDKQGGLDILKGRRGSILSTVVDKGTLFVLATRDYYNAVSDRLFYYQLDPEHPLKAAPLGNIAVRDSQHLAMCGDYLVEVVEEAQGRAGCLNIYSRDGGTLKFEGKSFTEGSGQVACRYPYIFVAVPEQRHRNKDSFVGMIVVSIADPTKPQIVATHSMPRITNIVLSDDGNVAAVGNSGKGFSWKSLPQKGKVTLLDVSIPSRPSELSSIDLDNVDGLYISRNRLYATTWNDRNYNPSLVLFDIGDPRKPQRQGTWKPNYTYGQILDFTERDGYIYIAQRYVSAQVVDARNPTHIVSGSTLPIYINNDSSSVFTAGDYLYISNSNQIEVWNISNPANPVRAGMPPKSETMGYMKRRARRLLRNLSKQNPDRFVQVAFETLKQSGATAKELSETAHWVSMDLLYGGGVRYYQQRHGRGRYSERKNAVRKINLRTREERGPNAWDAHPEVAAAFLAEKKLHWQTYEFAAKVLRSQGKPIPQIKTSSVLEEWLKGHSPLLSVLATRAIVGLLEQGQSVTSEAAARAFYWAGISLRKRLLDAVQQLGKKNEQWEKNFAVSVLARIVDHGVTGEQSLTRRAEGAALTIARQYSGGLNNNPSARELLVPFARTEREELVNVLTATARQAAPATVRSWIPDLALLTDSQREPIVAALEETLSAHVFPDRDAVSMTVQQTNEEMGYLGWRFLAASNTPQGTLAGIWNSLLELRVLTTPLRIAMTSPYAMALLTRAGITSEDLAKRLEEKPFLVELLNVETFNSLLDRAPIATVLNLVRAMPDDLWQQGRNRWLRRLQEGIGLADLWSGLPAALDEDSGGRIRARILGDAEFESVLLGLEDEYAETMLAIRTEDMDTLIGRWLTRHETPFVKNSGLLAEAATHVLPSVREWGLARSQALGFGLPFALRLLESEIPSSAAVGKTFFEDVPSGGEQEFDYALALCDSPIKSVRRLGREYVDTRWTTLPHTEVFRALFENPDPEVQSWIASLVNSEPSGPPETTQFHREVLRQRNRGRQAKEVVKSRQQLEPTLDVATLLELARGTGTPRDAEWAMSQLALRALAGEEIPGFTLYGVTG